MNKDITLAPGRVVLFNGAGEAFSTEEIVPGNCREGEIIVKNLYTTLCGSDIHTYCGHRIEPERVTLGHEIVAEVITHHVAGELKDFRGTTVSPGDRIVWTIFAAPENSVPPRPDLPQKSAGLFKYGHASCTSEHAFNGGLADYCVLRPNTAFVKIDKNIPLNVAATISCAHATVSGSLRIAGAIANKRVLIFGAGLLGLSCAAMCHQAGASSVEVADHDQERLKWARLFDASATYCTAEQETVLPEADIVFDMTGHPSAMETGLDCLALGGVAVWIGAVFPAPAVRVDAEKIIRKVLTVKGLHNYNYDDFIAAVVFIESNYTNYPFEQLVEKEFSLTQVDEAFAYAMEQKPVRVGIKI